MLLDELKVHGFRTRLQISSYIKVGGLMEKKDLIKNVYSNDEKKKAKGVTSRGSSSNNNSNNNSSSLIMRCCQADKCCADLTDAKQYHRRHKVCEQHAKAQLVIVAGNTQRFCQQCSRFHEISEFDESKRSCRRRLAGHNERRRKNPGDHHLQFPHNNNNNEATSIRKGASCSSSAGTQLNDIICG